MELTLPTQINAFIMFIAIIFVTFLSMHVIIHAIKKKERNLYILFICFISTITPWIPGVLDYLYWIFTDVFLLNFYHYVIVGTAFIPLAFFSWIYIYTTTMMPRRKNNILIFFGMISVIIDIILFYNLFFAPNAPVQESLPIIVQDKLDHYYNGFILIITIIIILTVVITGVAFGIRAYKSNERILQWRGKFIIIAYSLFITTIPDVVTDNQILLIPMRILQMFFFFFLYLGFVMPNWIKKPLKIS